MTKRILIKSIPEFKVGDKAVNEQTVRDKAIDAVYWLPGCTTQLDLDRTGGMWIEREVEPAVVEYYDLIDDLRWGSTLMDEDKLNHWINEAFEIGQKVRVTIKAVE